VNYELNCYAVRLYINYVTAVLQREFCCKVLQSKGL